jgi:hypothetical protein
MKSSGNIGINQTTDNGYRLQINSSGSASGSLYISGSNSQTLLKVDSPSSSNILFISGSGNVGIRTSSPGVELDVIGDIRANNRMFNSITQTNNIQTNGLNLSFKGSAAATYATMFLSTGNFVFQNGGTFTDNGYRLDVKGSTRVQGTGTTSATTALRVENNNASASLVVLDDGNVGIGTASPTQILDIQKNVADASFFGIKILDSQVGRIPFYTGVYKSTAATWEIGGLWYTNTPTPANYIFSSDGGSSYFNAASGNLYFGISNNYYMTMNANGLSINNGGTPPATGVGFVLGSGNALIGTTTNSGFKLDVNGTARIQNQLTTTGSITAASAIARGVYMNQTLVAAANNDVLVGLDINPTFTNGAFTGVTNAALRVNGNIISTGAGITTLGTGGVPFASGVFNNTVYSAIFQGYSGGFNFNVGSTSFGRFHTTTGNLTLQNGGTFTDAGFRLDVKGSTRVQGSGTTSATTALRVENANASASLVVLDNGNVGIGTTTPSASLHVIGNTILSGSARVTDNLTVTGSLNVSGSIYNNGVNIQTLSIAYAIALG